MGLYKCGLAYRKGIDSEICGTCTYTLRMAKKRTNYILSGHRISERVLDDPAALYKLEGSVANVI